MKIKCEYCGSYINDTDEKCPNCGGVNSNLKRNADEAPHTIEELKDWYVAHNLPPENVTRFFIGKNYKGARAFGIYKDETTGNFVVYKNKSDASRAVRYEGKDESYAVNELYMKLKEEIVNQKQHNLNNANIHYATYRAPATPNAKKTLKSIFIFIIFVVIFIAIVRCSIRPSRGYYHYDGNYYYYQSGTWYEYDDYRGWYPSYAPDDLADNYDDYYSSSYYSSYYGTDDFSDSSYYVAPSSSSSSSSDSSWDSSSSWDSGSSWDSSSSDWDSDW